MRAAPDGAPRAGTASQLFRFRPRAAFAVRAGMIATLALMLTAVRAVALTVGVRMALPTVHAVVSAMLAAAHWAMPSGLRVGGGRWLSSRRILACRIGSGSQGQSGAGGENGECVQRAIHDDLLRDGWRWARDIRGQCSALASARHRFQARIRNQTLQRGGAITTI
jgi:hypothetical protein